MSQLSRTERMQSAEPQRRSDDDSDALSSFFPFNQGLLTRVTGLIWLGFSVLDGLIGLRFMLKLVAANPSNPFASFVYAITAPALWVFRGLTASPSFDGVVIELYDFIAVAVYALLGWVLIRALWLLFARLR